MTALADIRVIDLADEPAVFATRLLADLGADVLRVEPPDGGRVRRFAPFLLDQPGPERSLYHLSHNANKRSLLLDWRTAAGAAELSALLAEADVLVESGAPGELAALGLGYDQVHVLNPRLVYVSVTPFGQTGPRAHWRANDLVATAAGGLTFISGDPTYPPAQPGADQAYKLGSLAAVVATLAALIGRDAGGDGAWLDVSLQEAVASAVVQTSNPNRYLWLGEVPHRPGMAVARRCRDGRWTTLNVRPDRFATFLEWAREAGLETDLTTSDWGAARMETEQRSNLVPELVNTLAAAMDRDALLEKAWSLDLVGLPINSFPDLRECPHFVATGQFRTVHHEPLGADLGFPRSAVDALGPNLPIRRAPTLGETAPPITRAPAPSAVRSLQTPPQRWRDGNSTTDRTRLPANLSQENSAPAKPVTGSGPLAGIRVLDFCWVLAGPLGTRLLANLGADVIRVESHARVDNPRVSLRPRGQQNLDLGGMHNEVNTAKRSLTLDLRRPEARDLVTRLAAVSDIVTNNYRPGAMARMGLGYDVLRAVNPALILLNMPGCGSTGPWASRGTFGNMILAASGLNYLSGFSDSEPVGLGSAYGDFTSPYALAIVALAALRERAATGRGRELDLSQLAVLNSLLGVEWMQFTATGEPPPRRANRDPNYAPHGVYACADEEDRLPADTWVAVAVEGDAQWTALCRIMGRPGLAIEPRFAAHAARKANEDALDGEVSAWTARLDRWQIAERLQAAGIAAAPVENLRDMIERDPQLAHRRHYQRLQQPSAPDVEITVDSDAFRFSGLDPTLCRAPMMGEHNEPVLRDLLGLSEGEFDALVVAGVIN